MNSRIALLLIISIVCLLSETAIGQPIIGSEPYSEQVAEASSRYVIDTCKSFAKQIKTLSDFSKFEKHYRQVNECLHRSALDLCKSADEACALQKILQPNVNSLGKLISDLEQQKQVCNMEFASRVYRLHQQLTLISGSSANEQQEVHLKRLLRSLANRVAAKCQSSLIERLVYVDKAAPDTMKHLSFIVGLTGVKEDKLATLPIEQGAYVPILEGEQVLHPRDAATIGGFEFKLAVKVGLDAVRTSCSAMKMYHLNLLGSLGLLASVGYAAPPGAAGSLQALAPGDAARLRIWLLSAVICQSLKTIVKVSSMSTDGKLTNRIMVLPAQEFDVSSQEEFDNEFAAHHLPEGQAVALNDELNKEPIDSFVYDSRQINLRKLQLLYGPSYQMAEALLSYLDISRPNRWRIPYALLSQQVPAGESGEEEDVDE